MYCGHIWVGIVINATNTDGENACALESQQHDFAPQGQVGYYNYDITNGICQVLNGSEPCPYLSPASPNLDAGLVKNCENLIGGL